MKVNITYSKIQLERAVQFISLHNKSFFGQTKQIKKIILKEIDKLVADIDVVFAGTMGFIIIADRSFEDLDNDENNCRIEIFVDPALGDLNHLEISDIHDSTINIAPPKAWSKQ
jgi:hypothetical protein